MVYTFIGNPHPGPLEEWSMAANVSRATFDLTPPGHLPPGAVVWVTARYYNPRHECGPRAREKSIRVVGHGLRFPCQIEAA